MEKLTIYGFRLGKRGETEFLPFKKSLTKYGHPEGSTYLRLTMANLLTYLLNHAVGITVEDKALQVQVWENHGLRCSSQRLWQVMNNLKHKLEQFDLPDNFIQRVAGKGYMIPKEMVLKLYCQEGFFNEDDDALLR